MTDRAEERRPIRTRKIGVRSIWRIPDKGYVTPRLREEERKTEAIGFHAHIGGRWGDVDGSAK